MNRQGEALQKDLFAGATGIQIDPDLMLDYVEAAKLLDIGTPQMEKLMYSGKLGEKVKPCGVGSVRFAIGELLKFKEANPRLLRAPRKQQRIPTTHTRAMQAAREVSAPMRGEVAHLATMALLSTGLSQKELATKLGLVKAVNHWVHKRGGCSLGNLEKLLDLLERRTVPGFCALNFFVLTAGTPAVVFIGEAVDRQQGLVGK